MTQLTGHLQGQVAIVTGGGRGIGQAIALALAAEGMAVAVAARTDAQLAESVAQIEAQGGRALAVAVDITDQAGIGRMLSQVEATLGPVDLLVNNAGIAGQSGPVHLTDAEMWWRVLEVNLRGAMLCSQAVLPGMIARGHGRIVNISSAASALPWTNVSAYAISKSALNRLSEIMALEVAAHNIAVFAVGPGLVQTAMTDLASSPEWSQWDDLIPRYFAEGRASPPEAAAQLVVTLASGQADTLSGRYISIHHDLEAMLSQTQRIREEDLYLMRIRLL